jgi:NAD(P)-dependent dehydrogenase (short-subunit alcohol dehydrogenase family)
VEQEVRALGRSFKGYACDFNDRAALRDFIGVVKTDFPKIDILVNNAGVAHFHGFEDLDFDNAKLDYDVNALGPLRVTHALQGNLTDDGKVIVVSSLIGSLGDNGGGGFYGYRMSKAAANMAGLNLAHEFRDRGITVVMLHPGIVATEMTGGRGKPPKEAGEQMFAAIERCTFADSGKFLSLEGKQEHW